MTAAPTRGPLGRLSLRGRLLAGCLLLVVAALLTSNALLVTLLQRQLVHQLDSRLHTAATVAARLPDLPGTPGDTAPSQLRDAVARELTGDAYVAHLDADGHVRQTLRPATGSAPRLPLLTTSAVAVRDGRPFQVPAEDGGDWRVIAVPLDAAGQQRTGAAPGGSAVMAGSLAQVSSTIRHLGTVMLVVDFLVLALLAGIGWFAVRAGLRPLRRIETTAAAIAGGDLSSRVPQPASTRTELGRLSTALNGMLDRIEAGDTARAATNERMRTFIADASHELRTPLFGIKGFTELYRMGGMPERTDVDSAMNRIEREAARLVRLVEDLLLLARLDEDATDGGAHLPLCLTPWTCAPWPPTPCTTYAPSIPGAP
ncbi:histidine kinase dimerization/phospho-acceptor domain-containing protein [Streptomyces shenzhenensis]|uniref:histidine kinase dimerization/phospho-acceptor domain-containing protein n=1 Tax=Streptomyces shenzhenensis TaxID=943815 RepID=UPI003D8C594A